MEKRKKINNIMMLLVELYVHEPVKIKVILLQVNWK